VAVGANNEGSPPIYSGPTKILSKPRVDIDNVRRRATVAFCVSLVARFLSRSQSLAVSSRTINAGRSDRWRYHFQCLFLARLTEKQNESDSEILRYSRSNLSSSINQSSDEWCAFLCWMFFTVQQRFCATTLLLATQHKAHNCIAV